MSIEKQREYERAKYERAYKDPRYRMGPTRRRHTIEDLRKVPSRGSYLDVSCGQGDMLTEAQRLGFDPVRGTEMLESLCNDRVVQATVDRLPFEDKSFDVVTMFDVIEHLVRPDDEAACRELLRVARRHVMLTANNQTKLRKNGDQLHVNIRKYTEWHELFKQWFAPHEVHWLRGPGRASEAWRIDIA